MSRFSGRNATQVIANATHTAKNMTFEGNQKLDVLDGTLKNDFSSGTLVNNITFSQTNMRGEVIDLGEESKHTQVLLFGRCNMSDAAHGFSVFSSIDGSNFFRINAIGPSLNPIDSFYHFAGHIVSGRYIKIGNEFTSDLTNFTLHYVKLK